MVTVATHRPHHFEVTSELVPIHLINLLDGVLAIQALDLIQPGHAHVLCRALCSPAAEDDLEQNVICEWQRVLSGVASS